ncbi:hypothetical protein MNBD_DELTA01-293 [hydrothermal vent metagenome]|uniref:Doubled CXXCH motif domain-containing protein n=1 Tax=hydrothermal vent metagenome TaxID=652676 RepID=A0A3B0QSE6_9ZZZZ
MLINIRGKFSKAITRKGLVVMLSLVVCLLAITLYPSVAGAAKKSVSKLCLNCHKGAKSIISKRYVHKPVAMGLCTSCHNPHTSKNENLIGSELKDLCFKCHSEERLLPGSVVHKPVKEGQCLACHDAHSTDKKGLVKDVGAKACYSCHPKENIAGKKNVHPEVKKGNCSVCHSSHSSQRPGLLVKSTKALCMGCHSAKSAKLLTAHSGLNVSTSDCASCHSPHSSDSAGILKKNLHEPFATGKCSTCHLKGSKKVKSNSTRLCSKCHDSTMTSFNKRYSHLGAGAAKNPCVNCHNPHASDGEALIKGQQSRVCYSCHGETEKYAERSSFTHSKLGQCSSCHSSHGSNERYFMKAGVETCSSAKCHETQGRFTHPVGKDIIDPRSGSALDCSTCHNPMGSPEEFILRGGKDRELCIKCHQV